MTLAYIAAATALGGILSVMVAALLSFTVLARLAPRLVSYAVGAMLGAAFLNLLPAALESGPDAHDILAATLVGLLAFFLLEKIAIWRHAHGPGDHHGHAHESGHAHRHGAGARPAGLMLLVGDAMHNLVDGVLIAAAFLTDPVLGVTVTLAVIAHEIPQEVGDFMVLLESGYTRGRALMLNALSSLTAVIGGVAGYFALSAAQSVVPYVLAVSAASFIYIAIADLVPNLHRSTDVGESAVQFVLILAGIATMFSAHQH